MFARCVQNTNAATATLEGGELEASVEPVTGLVLEPRASYINANYNSYPLGFGTLNDNQFRLALTIANVGSFGTLKKQERLF